MDLYQAIRARKSIRAFLPLEVENDKLQRILEAARLAPSARNLQEWRFVVVRKQETRNRLARAASNQLFIAQAPLVLVGCAVTDRRVMRCGIQAFPVDVAIAMDHITLAAVAEGLGTCWIGSFDQEMVKEILNIPREVVVVQLLPLGYPKDPAPVVKNRFTLQEIIHNERWD